MNDQLLYAGCLLLVVLCTPKPVYFPRGWYADYNDPSYLCVLQTLLGASLFFIPLLALSFIPVIGVVFWLFAAFFGISFAMALGLFVFYSLWNILYSAKIMLNYIFKSVDKLVNGNYEKDFLD